MSPDDRALKGPRPMVGPSQLRKPAVRLFTGLVGRPPDTPTQGPIARSTRPKKSDVLLHYCFDQLAGETKKEHCPCEERAVRVSRELADRYVKEELGDWLRVKNVRSATGFSEFRRAIVIRSEVVDGERLFKVPSPWEPITPDDVRQQKHEYIKAEIRGKARKILSTLFCKGIISQDSFTHYQEDAALDELFQTQSDAFLKMLADQRQFGLRKRFRCAVFHWWNNILGYLHLSAAEGLYMADAAHGVGAIGFKGDSGHLDKIDGAHQTYTGRVRPANFKPSYWNGAWDYSQGNSPDVDESDEDKSQRLTHQCEHYPSDDGPIPNDLAADDKKCRSAGCTMGEEQSGTESETATH
jgi:hypothetical protein